MDTSSADHDLEVEQYDVTAQSAARLAGVLGVTPRRIRQLAEERRIRRTGRGLYDGPHAFLGKLGAEFLGEAIRRDTHPDVVVAAGWLPHGLGGTPSAENLALWRSSAARWGYSETEAVGLLLEAAAKLGRAGMKLKFTREKDMEA